MNLRRAFASRVRTVAPLHGLRAVCLVAAVVAAPRAAHASGFEAARFGGEHGHAAGATPFALYYNPAALSLTSKFQAALHLTLALHSASFTRKDSDTGEEGL